MRPTLHEYVIEHRNQREGMACNSERDAQGYYKIVEYATLTNRAPRLRDFVPCDDDGNVLEKPASLSYYSDICGYQHGQNKIAQYQAAQDRVIFAGDWEVVDQELDWTQIRSKELKLDIEWSGNECDVTVWDSNWNTCDYLSANRIEDLPREITFKENVI